MKIEIQKEYLQTAVHRMTGAISDRSLSYIYIKASDVLEISTADMLFSVHSKFDAVINETGYCFVPAKLFSDLVKELPNGVNKLTKSEKFLHLVGGENQEFSMKIPLIDDETAFEPPRFKSDSSFSLDSEKFSYMIDQVQFSISQNSTRNFGTVGYLHGTKSGNLRLVGSDGFRLSYSEVTGVDIPKFLKDGVCLSKRALQEMSRMCGEGFSKISLSLSEDKSTLSTSVENYEIFIRLSSVEYPNYEKVIPEIKSEGINFSRSHMLHVIKRILIASDKTHALTLSFSADTLLVSSRNVGNFEAKEYIQFATVQNSETTLSINGKFLTEVLSAMKSDDFKIYFVDSDTPVLVKPDSEPNMCDSIHILVPIEDSAQS